MFAYFHMLLLMNEILSLSKSWKLWKNESTEWKVKLEQA
jgi:hypothetical protein